MNVATPTRNRRGTVLLFVLGLTMVVLTIAVGSLSIVRAQIRANEEQTDEGEAQSYALSALEVGRLLIANDSSWRTNRSNGTWINNQIVGSGTMSLDVVNPNGALNNSAYDPVVMTATGNKGLPQQKVQIRLTPTSQPYTCLQTALFANQAATFSSATIQNAGIVASNSTITA